MTTNADRAAELIGKAMSRWDMAGRPDMAEGVDVHLAVALSHAGLLAPDLPEPYVVAGVDDAAVTAWQPCYTIVRTDITGGAASEVEIPGGNVWIEQDGLIGFDVDHGEMYLDSADARDLADALYAAANHAEEAGHAQDD